MGEMNEQVKSWLGRYRELTQDASHIEQRIESLRSRLENPGAANLDGMPRSPGFAGDRLGQQLAVISDLEEELKAALTARWEVYQEIEGEIRQITGRGAADRKAVLRSKYLDLLSWPDLTFSFFGEREDFVDKEESYQRRALRLHGAAIAALTEILQQNGQLPEEGGNINDQRIIGSD